MTKFSHLTQAMFISKLTIHLSFLYYYYSLWRSLPDGLLVLLLDEGTFVNIFQMLLLFIGDSVDNSYRVYLIPPETELAPPPLNCHKQDDTPESGLAEYLLVPRNTSQSYSRTKHHSIWVHTSWLSPRPLQAAFIVDVSFVVEQRSIQVHLPSWLYSRTTLGGLSYPSSCSGE